MLVIGLMFSTVLVVYADTNAADSKEGTEIVEDTTAAVAAAKKKAEANEALVAQNTSGLYNLINSGNYNLFTNYVDGYSLWVDKEMVVDMSYSGLCTVLESDTKRIEIYKQSLAAIGKSGYITYSNKFLKNTKDHYLEYDGSQTIGAHNVNVVVWSRDKLSKVQNDKNYYLCMDIVSGGYAYTIFVKATQPISNLGGYSYLVENFNITGTSKQAYNRVGQAIAPEAKGWNAETLSFFKKYFGEKAELTWGIFEPETWSLDFTQLNYYESQFNYKFPILLNYTEFQLDRHPNLKERLNASWNNGQVLELTLQTAAQSDGNMMYDILQGDYDVFLYDYAQVIKDFEHPVLFRPLNEMNGDWCPYSSYNTSRDTLIFKEVYTYIYSIFDEVGVNNAIWIWNPNEASYPNFKWNDTLMYYPGDAYVDVVGMTAYNTGTYYATVGETWKEFKVLYENLYYNYCNMFQQPLMITEFASASMGGDKEQWVINMFNQITDYDRIKVAIWWDGCDWDVDGTVARSYIMDESPTLLNIFKQYLNGPWHKDMLG